MPQSARLFSKELVCQAQLGYWLYLPRAYEADPQQRWPLILFLHGAGERGADLEIVKVNGIPRVAERDDLPFVALSPQCPAHSNWMLHRQELLALLDETAWTLPRGYQEGLSHRPEHGRFRHLGPGPGVSGALCRHRAHLRRGSLARRFRRARRRPAGHGRVGLSRGQRRGGASERITARGGGIARRGVEARLTIYPEAGHDSWTETYDNPELYTWFLSHQQ